MSNWSDPFDLEKPPFKLDHDLVMGSLDKRTPFVIPHWHLYYTEAINIIDHKDSECICFAECPEGGIHFAVDMMGDGHIIAAEYLPMNYPPCNMCFYDSRDKWRQAVSGVDWIMGAVKEEEERQKSFTQDTGWANRGSCDEEVTK